ncbi:hypothetical protein [Motiliproteus sediminis]|uniref:hypothetical protein n=1 Tax=Motiliproteus sediminis TaxID=1468178 RepID=UPI001AEF7B4B|nr:hypothetical protein [Motiliproteus sediminis]
MKQHTQLIDHPPQAVICLTPCLQDPVSAAEQTYGGLRCRWCIPHRPGSLVEVTISAFQQQTSALALVVECELDDDGYRFELHFLDQQQAFAVRMMEQLCHINSYSRLVSRTEGRQLGGNAAALEWIDRFAEQFPA